MNDRTLTANTCCEPQTIIETVDYSIVVAGHGSRDPDGIREFENLVALIKNRAKGRAIYHGYLEFATPTIAQAVSQAIADGAPHVVILPGLLTAASHAKNDMPAELWSLKSEFPHIQFHFGAAMDLHPLLLRLCQRRIIEAEMSVDTVDTYVPRSQTCLVVVGRGTSDPDANSDISKLARMLEEGMGFGASYVCYAGTTKPLVAAGLSAAAKLGYSRIIVLPYFLFDGVLIKRIYKAADALKTKRKDLEILKASYLGADVDVADVFLERAIEGIQGRAHMNCSMCKYRVEIVGFETQVGTPQRSNHLPPKQALENKWQAYVPHPIEQESFKIIENAIDWSSVAEPERTVMQRLVHTSGDVDIVQDIFFSPGAVDAGIRALLRCKVVVTDVTMVESGIKRILKEQLGIRTWCGVHDIETELIAKERGLTRSAIGIRRAFEIFDNDLIIAIGDAPTAVTETLRLIKEQSWRPQLVIGLPVGFVGTQEAKKELKRCLHVPRITNAGTKGGSPWAAAVINALMIQALNKLTEVVRN